MSLARINRINGALLVAPSRFRDRKTDEIAAKYQPIVEAASAEVNDSSVIKEKKIPLRTVSFEVEVEAEGRMAWGSLRDSLVSPPDAVTLRLTTQGATHILSGDKSASTAKPTTWLELSLPWENKVDGVHQSVGLANLWSRLVSDWWAYRKGESVRDPVAVLAFSACLSAKSSQIGQQSGGRCKTFLQSELSLMPRLAQFGVDEKRAISRYPIYVSGELPRHHRASLAAAGLPANATSHARTALA